MRGGRPRRGRGAEAADPRIAVPPVPRATRSGSEQRSRGVPRVSAAKRAGRLRRSPCSRLCTSISDRASGAVFVARLAGTRLRDPSSAAVAVFAKAHKERVEFFQFLQWQADTPLGAAAEGGTRSRVVARALSRSRRSGSTRLALRPGPIREDSWCRALAIGAPPDPLSRAGPGLGAGAGQPAGAAADAGFSISSTALRANMRHAGVLRIDHVMSLQRLYWVPRGQIAGHRGAYVDLSVRRAVAAAALESHRQGCAVIGEDLGTVPPGFREAMQAANLLSYRVVAFRAACGRRASSRRATIRRWRRPRRRRMTCRPQGLLARPRYRLAATPRPLSRAPQPRRPRSTTAIATAGNFWRRWRSEGLITHERFGEFLPDPDAARSIARPWATRSLLSSPARGRG